MFSLTSVACVVAAVSSVSALVVPRATPPAGWATDYLEPYDTYHTRYLAIGCSSKHDTSFFDQCCHPLLATENAATALPAVCTASASASSSAATPSSTATADDNNDDEYDDCDDEDDNESSSSFPSSTPVATPTPTSTHKTTSTHTSTVKATTTATPVKTSTKTSSTAKAQTTAASNAVSASVYTDGFATFFYQNGVAGACGTVHKDTDFIAAIDADRYGNTSVKSSLCGKQVKITNPSNNKSVTVTIADACPTCENKDSIDLSEAAFKQIATLDEGMVKIAWSFV
ncbi:hypothetical protein H0H93_004509 [Arthromyces matolae]|nr:hypothetical protein H0H93_004509 [Arthromyces matolae]